MMGKRMKRKSIRTAMPMKKHMMSKPEAMREDMGKNMR